MDMPPRLMTGRLVSGRTELGPRGGQVNWTTTLLEVFLARDGDAQLKRLFSPKQHVVKKKERVETKRPSGKRSSLQLLHPSCLMRFPPKMRAGAARAPLPSSTVGPFWAVQVAIVNAAPIHTAAVCFQVAC